MRSCLETRPVRVQRPRLLPFPRSRAHHPRDVTPLPTIAYVSAMVNPSGRALEIVAVSSSGAARPPAS
jgi:hypothetical protein